MVNWLTGWGYRQSHAITGANNAGTGYQMKVTVHSGSGNSTGNDVYLKGHCTSFPSDIDFTDDTGNVQLDFWIEDPALDPCVAWVEVASNLSANQTIYIYYGKSGQSTLSNGANTMLSFDDFENGTNNTTPTGWTSNATIPVIATNNATYIKAGSLGSKFGPPNGGNRLYYSYRTIATINASNVNALEFDLKPVAESAEYLYTEARNGTDVNAVVLIAKIGANWCYHNGTTWIAIVTASLGTFYHFKLYDFDFTNLKFSCDVDGVNKINLGHFFASQSQMTTFGITTGGGATSTDALDNLFERKNVNPEPVNDTWGAEESSGALTIKTFTEIIGCVDSRGATHSIRHYAEKLGELETKALKTKRYFFDIMGLIDSRVRHAYKVFATEVMGMKDSRGATAIKHYSLEMLGSLETMTKVVIRTFNEKIGFKDTIYRGRIYKIFASDSFGMSDSVVKHTHKSLLEMLGIKDITGAKTIILRFMEILASKDVVTKLTKKIFLEKMGGVHDTFVSVRFLGGVSVPTFPRLIFTVDGKILILLYYTSTQGYYLTIG